ncbi:hypothetical protein, partial [Pseudomonas aeruginosa]|uniref:hypothetical protein n=1 Tax=Pseudomonas aeruginosa TaxID=287 RepID=UPI00107ED5B5
MRKILPLRAWLAAGLILGSPFSHAASNLVFCSEGSPAGFDPAQYTTGTDGSVAKIVKLEHAWRRLDGRNDD